MAALYKSLKVACINSRTPISFSASHLKFKYLRISTFNTLTLFDRPKNKENCFISSLVFTLLFTWASSTHSPTYLRITKAKLSRTLLSFFSTFDRGFKADVSQKLSQRWNLFGLKAVLLWVKIDAPNQFDARCFLDSL